VIYWAGKSSKNLHLTVERYPDRPRPSKKYAIVSIPGRNGDLIIDTGAYNNYSQYYEIGIKKQERTLPDTARAVAQWLYSPTSYQKLVDSYEPDVYRLAYYAGPTDIENIFNRFGRATIEFNCKPQRFLAWGDDPVTVPTGGALHNPASFPSLPIITLTGSGAGRLQVGRYVVDILALDGSITIDSDTQNAYSGTLNKNMDISCDEFPRLEAGENAITYTGGITGVEIIPRWWTL